MSPIGKVFTVLNLIGAGVFLGFAGSYLQTQHNWKAKHTTLESTSKTTIEQKDAQITALTNERSSFESASNTAQTQLNAARTEIARLTDDNKRLTEDNRGKDVVIAGMRNDLTALAGEVKAVNERGDAHARDVAKFLAEKNDAVNERVAAVIKKEELERTKAALEATIAKLTTENADLQKQGSELGLLVKVAEEAGFLRSMAAPPLSGEVVNVANNLVTIAIRSNESNIDIGDYIQKGKWTFGIFHDGTYKGEAVAQQYDASTNAVLCRLELVKGQVKVGDRAQTKFY